MHLKNCQLHLLGKKIQVEKMLTCITTFYMCITLKTLSAFSVKYWTESDIYRFKRNK